MKHSAKSKAPYWILAFSVLCAVLVILFFYFISSKQSQQSEQVGEEKIPESKTSQLPSFTIKTIDGKTITKNDIYGKVVFLNFFATWCPPCKAETPGIVALYNKYSSRGLIVLGISVDQENPTERVKDFVQAYRINYPVAIADREIVRLFGDIRSIPTSFLIDKNGRIRKRLVGYQDESTLERLIQHLLEEKEEPQVQI